MASKMPHAIKWLFVVVGLLCGLFGVIGGTRWYYSYGPERRIEDLEWALRSTPKERLPVLIQVLSKNRLLLGDKIDRRLALDLSRFGDKESLSIIMDMSERELSLVIRDSSGRNMLSAMTNRDLGEDVGRWKKWWADNKSLTQGEIYRDGFLLQKIPIGAQLSKPEVLSLLYLVHDSPESSWQSIAANRWLRDRGFEKWNIALEVTDSVNMESLLDALFKYGQYLGRNGQQDQPGNLVMGRVPSHEEFTWPLWKEVGYGFAAMTLVLIQEPSAMFGLLSGHFDKFVWAFLRRVPGTQQLAHLGMFERFFALQFFLLFGLSIPSILVVLRAIRSNGWA